MTTESSSETLSARELISYMGPVALVEMWKDLHDTLEARNGQHRYAKPERQSLSDIRMALITLVGESDTRNLLQ